MTWNTPSSRMGDEPVSGRGPIAGPPLVKALIGGVRVEAVDRRTVPVENPGNRTLIAVIPRMSGPDVDAAVRAARHALSAWSRIPPRERGSILARIADDLAGHLPKIARSLAEETGNALRTQAMPEAESLVDKFRYFAAMASEMKGLTIPIRDEVLDYSRREPFGVVGAIIPWNGPVSMTAHKVAPALAAGNTMVLKPSEEASLSVLSVASVCNSHLPPGVLNVVTGYGDECGASLARHPDVNKVSFTGSTEIGKSILRSSADRIVSVSLELGGKSPQIVFPDVGLSEWVLDGVIAAMRFTRQGQSCSAGSRLFLHRSIYDEFLSRLADKLRLLKIGNPLDPETDVGAIVSSAQFDKVCEYIDEGLSQPGATLLLGGLPPTSGPLAQGYFIEPTIFGGISNDWRIAREEIFGPVLCAIPWTEESEVLQLANDTHYGLAAYVWSRDIGQALRTAHQLEAGWVQVNQGARQFAGQSYGGYKQSGLGREYSLEGMIEEFTQNKHISVNLTH